MQQWSFSVDDLDVVVQVITGDLLGVYALRWVVNGHRAAMTVAHADRSPMSEAQLREAVRPLLAAATAPTPTPSRTTGLVRDWQDEAG